MENGDMALTKRQAANRLRGVYDKLLMMSDGEKRGILAQLHAPDGGQWTREEKDTAIKIMADGAAFLQGMAREMAEAFTSDDQRWLALDILREPVQVVSISKMARTLKAGRHKAEDIKGGAKAGYLAFTFSDNARRRVNGILHRIGAEVQEIMDRPEYLRDWTAATIRPNAHALGFD